MKEVMAWHPSPVSTEPFSGSRSGHYIRKQNTKDLYTRFGTSFLIEADQIQSSCFFLERKGMVASPKTLI
jgi:hypothetical protein